MKKVTSLLLAFLVLTALFILPVGADESELVAKDGQWEYLVVEEDPSVGLVTEAPAGWLEGNDNADWLNGTAPFAAPQWAKDIANTLFDVQYYSAFLRIPFTVDDAASVKSLKMDVIYDENPTVYINGTEVWTASGYKDTAYTAVDLTASIPALKTGENLLCVAVSNVYGGGLFGLSLTASKEAPKPIDPVDEEGKVVLVSAETTGFANFGAINDPANVLDDDQNTVTGSAFNGGVEQSVTVQFAGRTKISAVYVQCKDEGTTTNDDGSRGTYAIYAYDGEVETILGETSAMTGTDGGSTLYLDEALSATAVKIQITSWQGDCWACVADVTVWADGNAPDDPTPTPTPTPDDPTPTPTPTPDDPTPTPDDPTPTPVPTPDDPTPSAEDPTPSAAPQSDPASGSDPQSETPASQPSGTPSDDGKSEPAKVSALPFIIAGCALLVVAAIVVIVVLAVKKKKK